MRDRECSYDTRGLPRQRGFLVLFAYIYGRGGGLDGMASGSVVSPPVRFFFFISGAEMAGGICAWDGWDKRPLYS